MQYTNCEENTAPARMPIYQTFIITPSLGWHPFQMSRAPWYNWLQTLPLKQSRQIAKCTTVRIRYCNLGQPKQWREMWHSRWRTNSSCTKTVNDGLKNVMRALSTLCSAPTLALLCHNMVQNRTHFSQYIILLKNGNGSILWSPGGFSCKGVSLKPEVQIILALQAGLLVRNVCITAGWYLSAKIPL